MHSIIVTSLLVVLGHAAPALDRRNLGWDQTPFTIELGPRPYYLINDMDPGPLKDKLQTCANGPFKTSDKVFGHRGACLQFPEHTATSYRAAMRMGAGVIECKILLGKLSKSQFR
jgi:glycerophosphoryl diester phosphodiesterase